MSFKGYAKPIVAVMPRLNENNIQFIMDEYLERTDGIKFDSPEEIYECFEKVGKRRAYDVSPVENIDAEIEQIEDDEGSRYKITLSTNDFDGWFEFNCVIRVFKNKDGSYESKAIYLYVPSEFISAVDTFTIDTEVERRGGN